MTISRTVVIATIGLLLLTKAPRADGGAEYRGFQLGADVQSVLALAKMSGTEAKTIHQRPSLIQTLEWRPSYFMSGSTARENDPVQLIVFSFYEDQLYSIVVDYDRERTNGMTGADVIDAMTNAYGPPSSATTNTTTVPTQLTTEAGTPVAQWGDADGSIVLYQSTDRYRSSGASQFRLVVTSPRLEALSRSARVLAQRLDEQEAPQREVARHNQESEKLRASQEKARLANRAAFRP